MKKILGLVAMALLLGGPAFAANTSVVNYTLEIGGDNHAATYESSLAPPQFTHGQESIFTVPFPETVVTWDVVVDVSGLVDYGTSTDLPVLGAANIVWSLELYDSTNALVAIGAANIACDSGTINVDCLNAHPTNAGFFSSILDGDKDGTNNHLDAPRQLASFAYSVQASGSAPYARISDARTSNGPNMERSQPPSAAGYPAGSTAPQGKLVGMGAGYTSFYPNFADPLPVVAGVGLASTSCAALGIVPVAEGQISMKGLPSGTYTLKIVPGQGNNVLAISDCSEGTAGRFAVAASSVTTKNGGLVQFIYTAPPTNGTLAVALQKDGGTPAPAGAAWSTDAGATWHTEASLVVPTGTYTVSFKDVTGYTTPAAQAGVVITDGGTTNVIGNYITNVVIPPVAQSAVSRKLHGTATYDIPLPLTGNAGIECRVNGPTQIIVTYDKNIGGTPAITLSAGTFGSAAVGPNANQLTVNLSAVPNGFAAPYAGTCLTVTINGVADAGNPAAIAAAHTVKVGAIYGDVNGNRTVNAADIGTVKFQSGKPVDATNFKCDLNCNNAINAADVGFVKLQSGKGTLATCP